jgi:hypothetical protein
MTRIFEGRAPLLPNDAKANFQIEKSVRFLYTFRGFDLNAFHDKARNNKELEQ